MIKYIGSKRKLLPWIVEALEGLSGPCTVLDLFSGTSRVGHALKERGYRVLANDTNAYAQTLARCYVQADRGRWQRPAARLIEELNALPGEPGWFTETYCLRSRYLQPKNGARVEAIRDEIARRELHPELEAIALVALMEAADRVDSTTGLQMAYLKSWAPRSFRDLALRMPVLHPRATAGKGKAHGFDARDAAERLTGDVAYLDPPYNQHSYLGNYHVWETLVRWDAPAVYGVACKRMDCRTRKSDFNSKTRSFDALAAVVERVRARHLIVSFNNEGFVDRTDLEALLGQRGTVRVVERDYARYVGARIGIHNPRGERVGTVGHLKNKEYLFVVSA